MIYRTVIDRYIYILSGFVLNEMDEWCFFKVCYVRKMFP